jgi:hypothetical protein
MLRNSIQHYLYYKQKEKETFINFLKLMKVIVYFNIPFAVLDMIIKNFFGEDIIIFSGYMFLAGIIVLIYYWMPNKKEYVEWIKKNHSTF